MGTDEGVQRVIDVAVLMCQELQEFVDDAIEASGDESALSATQELIADFEAAMAESGVSTSWQRLIAAGPIEPTILDDL